MGMIRVIKLKFNLTFNFQFLKLNNFIEKKNRSMTYKYINISH